MKQLTASFPKKIQGLTSESAGDYKLDGHFLPNALGGLIEMTASFSMHARGGDSGAGIHHYLSASATEKGPLATTMLLFTTMTFSKRHLRDDLDAEDAQGVEVHSDSSYLGVSLMNAL